MPTVALHTLGCKLNHAETSMISRQFLEQGYTIVDVGTPADVCVINTCSVTARADRECRQLIRRAVRTSRDPYVVVTGCYAQLEPEEVASIAGVDLVLGAREKFELFRHAGGFTHAPYPRVHVSPIDSVETFGVGYTTQGTGRTRAFLKIQDGCDYNCSFCTIPRARGGSRSQEARLCLAQARDIVASGFREIVLTGVNIGDYRDAAGVGFLALLGLLAQTEGLQRLRISSIEPNLLSDDIISLVAGSDLLCNHFHIPLQSGSSGILRTMRRRYTTTQYASLLDRLHERIPACGIGVDVIVGFPGETEADFEETCRYLDDLPLTYLHVFTYSERPGTPAATLPGTVSPAERARRNEILRALSAKKKDAFYRRHVGNRVRVLLESDVTDGFRYGFSDTYVRVGVPAEGTAENMLVPVDIAAVSHDACVGRIASGASA